MEFAGRNRRYYKITDAGMAQLRLYLDEWIIYNRKINNIFEGVK
jgi:PadR family transcriptional regulator PadR